MLLRASLVLISLSAAAQAPRFRAYVASDGSDADPCTLPQPCRLLPAAIAAVASGGEIWMLDSANYNTSTVTIDKPVSILAVPGAIGSLVTTGGPAISVTADSIRVGLRNLVITSLAGAGGHGILITGSSVVALEKSLVEGIAANFNGIYVAGGGRAYVADTTFRAIGANGFGVYADLGGAATVTGSRFLDSHGGVIAAASGGLAQITHVGVSDSGFMGCYIGAMAYSTSNASAHLSLNRVTIELTNYAVDSESVGGAAIATVGDSKLTHNGYAWYQSGGGSNIYSYGNNQVSHNEHLVYGSVYQTLLQ
jgi:hypothetical protein